MPNSLVLLVHERTGSTFPVTDSGLTIGRDASCDVILSPKGISRLHASIHWQGEHLVLRDESANGTAVGGSAVNGSRRLQHGDGIEIGGETLRLEWVPPQPASVAPPTDQTSSSQQATMLLPRVDEEVHSPSAGPRSASAPLAILEVRNGRQAGQIMTVPGPVCSLGRSEASDVRLADPSVSSSHATLLRKGTQWFVVDLGSSNGTFVEGYRVAGEREVPNGCTLGVGDIELTFRTTFQPGRDAGGTRMVRGLAERFGKLW